MSRFMTTVIDLVREKCRTTILHDDMTLCRLMVYDQSIEESELGMITINLKEVVQVIKVKLGSRRRSQLKMNLGVLR